MENQTPLKLEVGKRYENRRGQITIISNITPRGEFVGFNVLKKQTYCYREDGVYNSCVETYFDLIKEVN